MNEKEKKSRIYQVALSIEYQREIGDIGESKYLTPKPEEKYLIAEERLIHHIKEGNLISCRLLGSLER